MINRYSPLRYPGGKSKTAQLFAQIIDLNGLGGCTYVEPFAGGSSVALFLLKEKYVDRIIINDADKSIFAFWYSVLNQTEDFCKLLRDTPINVEQWRCQKENYIEQLYLADKCLTFDTLSLGFATFFLNRTNRSGIIKGGIIGGRSQSGNYGIDARFNKKDLESRISAIANLTNKIELHCEDAKMFIPEQAKVLSEHSLFYCDPPYVLKGKGLYMNYFKENDHSSIAESVQLIKKQHWIVTYDSVPLIEKLYGAYRMRHLLLSYSAHTHVANAKEFIVFSDSIEIPKNKIIQRIQ